jgi:hypothetical protein
MVMTLDPDERFVLEEDPSDVLRKLLGVTENETEESEEPES